MAVVLWKYSNPYAATSKLPVRKFTFNGQRVDIGQNLDVEVDARKNTHEKLWDGSYLLASFLGSDYFPHGYWKGKNCMELGCGTGLVGLVAWLHGATVELTDLESSLGRVRENLLLNVERLCSGNPALKPGCIAASALDWCTASDGRVTYDVILGSEVVYLPEMSSHLLRTLERMASLQTSVFIAYKERGLGEANFWQMLAEKQIVVETIDSRYYPSDFAHSTYKILKFSPLSAP